MGKKALSKFWDVRPLHTLIVEVLLKKRGTLTDAELYKELEKSHGDLSFRLLNKTLMRLEVDGIIQVFNLTKNKRRVELVET